MTENRHAYGHSGGYAAEPKTGYGDVAADQSKTGYGSVETEPPATGYGLHNSPVRFIVYNFERNLIMLLKVDLSIDKIIISKTSIGMPESFNTKI